MVDAFVTVAGLGLTVALILEYATINVRDVQDLVRLSVSNVLLTHFVV